MAHPAKTLFADPVVYTKNSKPHVAFVIKVHDDYPHMACLVYYCPDTHNWYEAMDVKFNASPTEGCYSNPEFVS